MKFSVSTGKLEQQRTGGAVLFLFHGENFGKTADRIDKALGGLIGRLMESGAFKAKPGAVHLIHTVGRMLPERVVLAGLGKRSGFGLNGLRQAVGKAACLLRTDGALELLVCADGLGPAPEEAAQALVEGGMLGLYRFLRYKTNGEEKQAKDIVSVVILTETAASAKDLRKGVRIGKVIAEAVVMARDMVSTPSADMTPTVIADRAKALAREFGFAVKVLDRRRMAGLGMGALLGVASGSAQPPKFIVVEYRRGGKKPFIALVGKTITFDSGGISIKPADNMDRMKDDMSGGAAVLGAIRAAAALKLPINLVGLLPAAENMPGGNALRPGDVLRTLSGRTIEIVNTDAEGRLILSDALAYACRYKPSMIVDIATLTGASTIALGQEAIAMLGKDEALKRKLRDAGETTGERVWELPLWDEYYDLIKSDIADVKNSGGRSGSVITAAALLSQFVQAYPWAHLDIASTAWTDKERPYTPKGATGIGVRLLTQFLRDCAAV
jgi:leucyl aminopeptidase